MSLSEPQIDLSCDIERTADRIVSGLSPYRAFLIGLSGIDASGKGYVGELLRAEIESRSAKTALLNVDAWLNLPSVRFGEDDPGSHFYEHALRLDEMFETLVQPLAASRSVRLTALAAEETATEFHETEYAFDDVDVVLVEGIFIFKRRFISLFDLRIWIDCPFDVALGRAISRSQEGLDAAATIEAYKTIYFPAQETHFLMDDPRSSADLTICNA